MGPGRWTCCSSPCWAIRSWIAGECLSSWPTMAAGTPVIASAVSGIPELVEHEVNGLLVAPEDAEALADSLLRLHDDPALAATLAGSGRETVASRFDGPQQAVRLAELFQAAVHS